METRETVDQFTMRCRRGESRQLGFACDGCTTLVLSKCVSWLLPLWRDLEKKVILSEEQSKAVFSLQKDSTTALRLY